jgi:hypothetical protein
MDAQYVQNLRYKLQRRFRRLNSARWEVYHSTLVQFWRYINERPSLVGILEDLVARCPSASATATSIVDGRQAVLGETELESAAIGAHVLRLCAEKTTPMPEVHVGHIYSHEAKHSDNQRYFTELFAEPLYEYLDEQLDDRGAILAVLRSYKHKVEWFGRKGLYDAWFADTSRGEKHLALHLYEYLHDQGVRFFIEPSSVSGETDLVSSQQGDEPLLADAKVFNPEKSKSAAYIAQGFKQLYTYCVDFNESVGYLIIFKTSPSELKLVLDDERHGTPFVVFNNKTIFFVVIDIYPHTQPASKRGTVKAVELTATDLIGIVRHNG